MASVMSVVQPTSNKKTSGSFMPDLQRVEFDLCTAIRRLQNRDDVLTHLERLKLKTLLLNLDHVRGAASAPGC